MKSVFFACLVTFSISCVNSSAQACDCPASFSCTGSYVATNNCNQTGGSCRGKCKCKHKDTGAFDDSKTVKCEASLVTISGEAQHSMSSSDAPESCQDPVTTNPKSE